MDRHFLEFWGNLMIQAAKGQKQSEDLSQWFNQGVKVLNEITTLFGKFYGLEPLSYETPSILKSWEKAFEDFQRSFKEYLTIFGFVPRQEYDRILQEYEALKNKVTQQKETIKKLQMLLTAKAFDPSDMAKGFQDLIRKQTDQLQDLMRGLGTFGKKIPQKKGSKDQPS